MADPTFKQEEILEAIAEVCAELAAGCEMIGLESNLNLDVTLNDVTYRINVDVVKEEKDATVH